MQINQHCGRRMLPFKRDWFLFVSVAQGGGPLDHNPHTLPMNAAWILGADDSLQACFPRLRVFPLSLSHSLRMESWVLIHRDENKTERSIFLILFWIYFSKQLLSSIWANHAAWFLPAPLSKYSIFKFLQETLIYWNPVVFLLAAWNETFNRCFPGSNRSPDLGIKKDFTAVVYQAA